MSRGRNLCRALLMVGGLALVAGCGGGGGDGTAAPVTGNIVGRVLDTVTGAPLADASVRAGEVTIDTDEQGNFVLLDVPVGERVVLQARKNGYENNYRIVEVEEGIDAYASVVLLPVGVTASIEPAAGGEVEIPGSTARVDFPPGAIDASAQVIVTLTDINPSASPANMPGDFTTGTAASAAPIESFGALAVNLFKQDGSSTNLRSGSSAVVRIPLSTRSAARPSSIPLYFFDAESGLWVEQGSASLQTAASGEQYYEGSVGHFSYWNADKVYETVMVTGCVQDPEGNAVGGVRISSSGIDYTGTSAATSGADGRFRIPVRASSRATLNGGVGLRVASTRSVTTGAGPLDITSSCLQLTSDNAVGFTITLTWGEVPRDLDSWLRMPEGDHISFTRRGNLTMPPYANLDVDDTGSFGPEVITVLRPRVGVYRYFVHNYSGTPSPGITASPARVELNANGVTQVFVPPAGETSASRYWTVFDLAVAEDCSARFTVATQPWTSSAPTLPQAADATLPYCER